MVTIRKACKGNGIFREKPALRRKDETCVYTETEVPQGMWKSLVGVQEFMLWGGVELSQIGNRVWVVMTKGGNFHVGQ